MLIRPAVPADALALARVQVDTWRTAYASIMPQAYLGSLDYPRVARRWRAVLTKSDTAVWLAEQRPDASGLAVVGFAAAGRELEGDPEYRACLQGLYVLPSAQGQGLGRLLLTTAVNGLVASDYPNLLLWVLNDNPVRHYYERMGAVAVRARTAGIGGARLPITGYAWAELDLLHDRLRARAPMGAFVGIRPAHAQDALGIGQVHVAVWRQTYQGLVPQAHLDKLDASRSAAAWARAWQSGHNWVVYGPDGDIQGFASAGQLREAEGLTCSYDGELYAIYLMPGVQGRGIGGRMMALVADRLGRTGQRSLATWVLEANRACGFYAALGGQPAGTKSLTIGGSASSVKAYGWLDLAELTRRGLGL